MYMHIAMVKQTLFLRNSLSVTLLIILTGMEQPAQYPSVPQLVSIMELVQHQTFALGKYSHIVFLINIDVL